MASLKAKYKRQITFLGCLLFFSFLFTLVPVHILQAPIFSPNPEDVLFKEKLRQSEINFLDKKIGKKQVEIESLKELYAERQPDKFYLVVNTASNEVKLMNHGRLIHRGHCSTGSYILLKADGNRQWLFRTPKGAYRVTVKLVDPWWYKPDWAYVEEGLPIPSKYSRKRYQGGVLGDYALGFGNGYLVHGTLYKRFLGLAVTHGCVRLDDEDMSFVFNKLTHGSRIYIY